MSNYSEVGADGSERNRQVRACMVAYTFYESDNRVRRYAEALVNRGYSVDAVALRRKGQARREVINGVCVHRIQSRERDETGPMTYLRKLLMFFFKSAWVITRSHLRWPYDIIHVHSVPDFQVFATILPRLMGARVILDIHDMVPELYAAKFNVKETSWAYRSLLLIERLSAQYSHHVIISNHLWHKKLLARRSVPPEKCSAIINYPDPTIFSRRPEPAPNADSFVMCYPGTLLRHQGLDLAIKAMVKLRDVAPHLRFIIIGDGSERENLQTMIRANGLEHRISLTGTVPMEEVAATMARVDLGVVPKRAESFGNEAFSTKIPEFMCMGVPVVAARTRIDQHYFDDTMIQFFEPGNVDDLAAQILRVMNDSERRSELVANAGRWIHENSWSLEQVEYLRLVDRLTSGPFQHRVAAEPASLKSSSSWVRDGSNE